MKPFANRVVLTSALGAAKILVKAGVLKGVQRHAMEPVVKRVVFRAEMIVEAHASAHVKGCVLLVVQDVLTLADKE